MIKSLIHSTKNGNLYLFDDSLRLSLLIHPDIKIAHEKSTDVDPYYLKKYEYLKEHGFFSKPRVAKFEKVTEEMIKSSISRSPQIIFEVTDECNLKCTYCGLGELYEGHETRKYKKINTRTAVAFLRHVFELKSNDGKTRVTIGFYGGEPLLNMRFIKKIVEISDYLNPEKKWDIHFSMTTNATLLHKHIDFLVANKFRLLISLDGNKINHSYRIYAKNNKNSFRKVIENIDMIQRDYPEYFISHVMFNTVLHNRNSVKDIYEFIYNRYSKIPRISELTTDNVNPEKTDVFKKIFQGKGGSEEEYLNEKTNLLKNDGHNELLLYKALTDFLKYYSINHYIADILELWHRREVFWPTCTCQPFQLRTFLTSQGKLLPCERINHKYSLGKVILDEQIIIDYKAIAQKYNFYYDRLKEVCQYCYGYRFCGLCMYSIKNLSNLDIDEFVCSRFYDQEAYIKRLYNIFSFLEEFPNDFFQIIENDMIQ